MTSSTPPKAAPLTFPAPVFAKIAPGPYLKAHLQPADSKGPSTRPSGRAPLESRKPAIHAGSLSHSNGSAVVRLGSTAIVCGVRAEILRAQDVPQPFTPLSSTSVDPQNDEDESETADEISELGLLIPNLELSTGCSPGNLPGNPPSTIAQSLTHRLHSLLHSTHILQPSDLRITTLELVDPDADDLETGEKKEVTQAYWALYIDVLVMSHDGSVFDAAWLAVLAALRDLRLPRAEWDADREMVVCDPRVETSRRLDIRGTPLATTFVVFETGNRIRGIEGRKWVLADADAFEEGVCRETICVVIQGTGEVVRIEKIGGIGVGKDKMRELISVAEERGKAWEGLLRDAVNG